MKQAEKFRNLANEAMQNNFTSYKLTALLNA